MALFRNRTRWSRFILLAVLLVGTVCVLFSFRTTASSLSTSPAWATRRDNDHPSFGEPERPRAKMPTTPLTRKHKTRNGRPPRVGPAAGRTTARATEVLREVKDTVKTTINMNGDSSSGPEEGKEIQVGRGKAGDRKSDGRKGQETVNFEEKGTF